MTQRIAIPGSLLVWSALLSGAVTCRLAAQDIDSADYFKHKTFCLEISRRTGYHGGPCPEGEKR